MIKFTLNPASVAHHLAIFTVALRALDAMHPQGAPPDAVGLVLLPDEHGDTFVNYVPRAEVRARLEAAHFSGDIADTFMETTGVAVGALGTVVFFPRRLRSAITVDEPVGLKVSAA